MKLFPAFQVPLLVGVAASGMALVQDKPAQDKPAQDSTAQSSSSSSTTSETVAKPLTKKQLAKKQKELEKELAGPWKKWMSEDVTLHHHG